MLVGAGDHQREHDADDRKPVGEDRRPLPADVIGQGAGHDDPRHREKRAHAEHFGGIELVEADIGRESELVQRYKKAAEPGAEIPRAMPFADCKIEIAMPRLRMKCRDSIGTNTTRPRQLAPIVMTTPYSTTISHSAVTNALPSSPATSSPPPSSNSRREPSR